MLKKPAQLEHDSMYFCLSIHPSIHPTYPPIYPLFSHHLHGYFYAFSFLSSFLPPFLEHPQLPHPHPPLVTVPYLRYHQS